MARYTDIDLDMTKHPLTGDIVSLEDVTAIKRSVKHILQTNFGEKPFQPKFGSNLRAQLFEPGEPFTALNIRKNIIFAIEKYEPRVQLLEVKVFEDVDKNSFEASVHFLILSLNTDAGFDITIKRTR